MHMVDYWVFTSGENGIHGLDWGVKFASPSFADKYALDVEYRNALKSFSLSPSLTRPNDSGLLVLPFRDNDYIAGFIFPGTDHGGRLNTSAVIALIPREISCRATVNGLIASLWGSNDIPAIARKNSPSRPDSLNMTGEGDSVFPEIDGWPDREHGLICVDGEISRLYRAVEAVRVADAPPKRSNAEIVVAGLVVMAAIVGGYFVMTSDDGGNVQPEIVREIVAQPVQQESQPQIVAQESQQPITAQESQSQDMIQESPDEIFTPQTVPAMITRQQPAKPDKDKIIEGFREILGGMKILEADGGFQVVANGLPIDEWRMKKAEILGDREEISSRIKEITTEAGYRIVFTVHKGYTREKYDFDDCMSDFIDEFIEQE